MAEIRYYETAVKPGKRFINIWDFLILTIIFSLLFALAWGATQMATPYQVGEKLPIRLDISLLPLYAIRTTLRMLIAMIFSLLFTFIFGAWAAKSKSAQQFIIPAIDILQSVPVLSFLSLTIVGFIALFPGSLLGPECASIFAIFTAQAWNMTLGFYQSLRLIPQDLKEAANMFHLTSWARFCRVEVPFSLSSLLWNSMMSMSASWFFVVASEAISVSKQSILLPGIGSYIYVAIQEANMMAVIAAILMMLVVILIYDQLLFRPLLYWSDKFKFEQTSEEKFTRSWFLNLLQRTHLLSMSDELFVRFRERWIHFPRPKPKFADAPVRRQRKLPAFWSPLRYLLLIGILFLIILFFYQHVLPFIHISEIFHVLLLGTVTGFRVIILIVFCSLLWVPVGVWIARKPRLAMMLQPVIQFVASFPAYCLFPLVVMIIAYYHLNPEIWTSPLMILGSQWYILFNVIAGALNIPKDLYQVAANYGLTGWQWWKRLALPAIFPYYVTGAITAAGGAWNASIVAEWVSWGDTLVRATGLGAYITQSTMQGDFPRIALGTLVMCLFVLLLNRLVWRPLYVLAEERCHIY